MRDARQMEKLVVTVPPGIIGRNLYRYIRTPERLLGRVNSLGAGMGFIVIALASLFFGWLVNATSARTGLLAFNFSRL
jgi:hypothetical protein